MRSARPKVLHRIAGQSLLAHVLDAVSKAGGNATAVVVGPNSDTVATEAKRVLRGVEIFVQAERRGTAHAVLAARDAIARTPDDVLVIFGDTPLIRPQTLLRIREALAKGAAVVVLGFRPRNATGYGRLVVEGDELVAIREELDASPAERAIELCNGGLMAFAGPCALPILERIGNDNRKGEYYLTDAIAIARSMGRKAVVIETEEDDVRGINTKAQLAETEAALQQRLREAAMEAGVTLVAPETVFLSADTKFGRDVVVEPFVVFGPRRHGRGQRADPLLFPSRPRACRQGRGGRALRAVASRCSPAGRRPYRQLRRDQGGRDRDRRQGQSPELYRRRHASAPAPMSAPAPSPAITTASPSTAPRSARAPSSAPTRRWSRR